MKRFLSILLVAVFALSLCACSGNSDTPAPSTAATESAAPAGSTGSVADQGTSTSTGTKETKDFQIPTDLPPVKIGCVGTYSGNELYIQWKENLKSLEKDFNVEFQFVEISGGEDIAAAVENLCTSGVKGIMTQGASEPVLQICQKYGVAVVGYCTVYPDDQMKVLSTYDNFVGLITEDDIVAAKHCAESMYEAGCRNVAVCGLTRGLTQMMDNRADYFIERFEELGGKIIATDYTMVQFANSISTFAAAYPEMDGVFSVILNESVFQTIATEGLIGQVKLGGFDMSDSCGEFFDNGTLVFTCTGQQATIVTAFAPLYNYIYDGTKLVPDTSKMVSRSFVEIHNPQEAADYDQYVRFSTCYSPAEIGFMIKGFNPDYTFEQYQAMHQAFSIQDVMDRTVQ